MVMLAVHKMIDDLRAELNVLAESVERMAQSNMRIAESVAHVLQGKTVAHVIGLIHERLDRLESLPEQLSKLEKLVAPLLVTVEDCAPPAPDVQRDPILETGKIVIKPLEGGGYRVEPVSDQMAEPEQAPEKPHDEPPTA